MLKFIEKLLSEFRICFSRTKTYNWFLVIISALLTRYDSLGVASFIRALSLKHRLYETMLHFFRSSAYKTSELKQCWHRIVWKNAPFIRIGNHLNSFCIPLDLTIQDGLKATASWINGNLSNSLSHVIQMIRNGHAITQTFASDTYFALDRYFLTVPLLRELSELNASSAYRLDIITRAKMNCTAYYKPQVAPVPHRGRPRKKGNAVRLSELFESRSNDFTKATAFMYGKNRRLHICLCPFFGELSYIRSYNSFL